MRLPNHADWKWGPLAGGFSEFEDKSLNRMKRALLESRCRSQGDHEDKEGERPPWPLPFNQHRWIEYPWPRVAPGRSRPALCRSFTQLEQVARYSPHGYLSKGFMFAHRRLLAFLMLLSFAGSQSASAGCAMMAHADGGPNAEHGHEHKHTAATNPEDGKAHPLDADGTQVCTLMMACATAAPGVGGAVPTTTLHTELWPASPVGAHLSPSLAFDPPPPRARLI